MENNIFDKLVEDVINNPEILLDSTIIDNDKLLELQKRLNPYFGSVSTESDKKTIAVCSYTNLREDYIKRFTMTSLISFMFQMLHEYEIPKKQRVWKPVSPESKEIFNIKQLKESITSVLDIINNIENIQKEESKILSEDIFADKTNELYNVKQKKIGLIYTVTMLLRDIGFIADEKLHITAEEANKYPEVKEIIKNKKHSKYLEQEFPEQEFPENMGKEIINMYLKYWLSFDPSVHIRNGMDKDKIKKDITIINDQEIQIDPEDSSHLLYEVLKLKIKASTEDKKYLDILTSNKKNYNSALYILREENTHESIRYMLDNIEKFRYYLMPIKNIDIEHIPPQDTFHRWNYFTEVNYEEIRTLTECIYPEKPDLDWALAIWTMFVGNDQEIEEQFTNFCQKNQDNMPSTVKSIEVGKWCFLADFKENRKNIQFYNKNTDVLKKIIDRHTEDKKIGTELMRNRVRQTKAKNIAESGPDAPGLDAYKSNISKDGKDLVSKGAEKVITPEEMKRLEKASGSIKAAKELEVLEEYERIIEDLEKHKKYRNLTEEEEEKYSHAIEVIKQAKEMLNVPDDAIQIDVFTNDPSTGKFNKSHFYTKSEETLNKEAI